MDGGAWWAAVHGVAEGRTRLSNFTLTFHFHALEKEMATHSSDLAWRIPGTGEPGGLPSMGSHRVGHDWSDLAAAAHIICSFANITIAHSKSNGLKVSTSGFSSACRHQLTTRLTANHIIYPDLSFHISEYMCILLFFS